MVTANMWKGYSLENPCTLLEPKLTPYATIDLSGLVQQVSRTWSVGYTSQVTVMCKVQLRKICCHWLAVLH